MSLTLTTDQADQLIAETEVHLARAAFNIQRQAQDFVTAMTVVTLWAAATREAGS